MKKKLSLKSEPQPVVADNQCVPAVKTERERIRKLVEALPLEGPVSRNRLEELARSIVDEEFLAWTMVLIGSRFWRDRVRAVPFNRRLLLLPHCMRNSQTCPATYTADGLLCENCGACPLGSLKTEAEELDYHVMIAEGSPIVMQWILGGRADAILGLGCLRSLERAFDKLQLAGIPALAVPLHASECRDGTTDLDWAREMIHTPFDIAAKNVASDDAGPEWLHLLRAAGRLFDEEKMAAISDDPVDSTKRIGLEFLKRGGKFYRPFITLAVYDALTGSRGTSAHGGESVANLSEPVKATARAVEIFHKASLVHDDIEDDDPFRYGKPTLHRSHGTAVAVNVGDYLLGLGYKTVAALRKNLPGDVVAEMLGRLSEAHTRLSEGQGAELAWKELAWKDADGKEPQPLDVLRIYVLKTSPAFEAAMALGVLLAIADEAVDWNFYRQTEEILARFSRHLGVAFQIRNDLDDWRPDNRNKRVAGGDVLRGRPTLLRALGGTATGTVEEIYEQFRRAGVFEMAGRLAEKHTLRARRTAEEIEHAFFRRLLLHFVDTITGN